MNVEGLWGISGLEWPVDKELMDKAKRETLTSRELLALKSASFYGPIQLLELARGANEKSKEFYVRICYDVLRELDECEDASSKALTKDDKIWAIDKLSLVVENIVRRDPNGNSGKLEAIIRGDDLKSLTDRIVRGAVDEKARIFIEQFGKGIVLRDICRIGKEDEVGKEIKLALDYCVKSMALGMRAFLDKGPLQTPRQLDDYCYHVAGKIGSGFLNKLVKLKDIVNEKPVELDDELAEQFGRYLQLINIAKNIRSDYAESRRFLPEEWRSRGISYEVMMEDYNSLNAGKVREEVFNRLVLDFVGDRFSRSISYVKYVPLELSGFKAFCLVPLITGQKTIENMIDAGADKVFKGEEDAIKISYGIGTIMNFSYYLSTYNNGANVNGWLEEFRKNPRGFSFKPDDYITWAPNWIGIERDVIKMHLGIS